VGQRYNPVEGRISGNEYLSFSGENKKAYITGLLDGVRASRMLTTERANFDIFDNFLCQLTPDDVMAIIEIKLKAYPEVQRLPLNETFMFCISGEIDSLGEGKVLPQN
jgi:hypothetical protein